MIVYERLWQTMRRRGISQYRLIRDAGLACTVGVPVENEEGTLVAYLFVDVAMRSLLADMNKFALPITLAILLVTALITWIHNR